MVDQPYIIKPRRGFVGRLRWWLFRQNPFKRIRAYEEALTPSGDTKYAYIGEVRIPFTWTDENGYEHTETVAVTWDATKQIMKMIRSRAES